MRHCCVSLAKCTGKHCETCHRALKLNLFKADDNDLVASDFAEVQHLLHLIKDESKKLHGGFADSVQGKPPTFPPVHFDDKTEASINRPVADNLFESDIVLNVHQARNILDEIRSGKL